MSYRIKSVAELTGISTTTLRAWERRYGFVSPQRSDSGYRQYSEEDIARLAQVKTLIDKGFKVSEAIDLVRRGVSELAPADVSAEELAGLRDELLKSLLDLDRPAARDVTERLASIPFDRQLREVFLPVLRRVGDLWADGTVSVAHEHFASAVIRERMEEMLDTLTSVEHDGPEAVCAGAPGELHELGLMTAAIHLAMQGVRILYLGLDMPLEDLRGVLHDRRPQWLLTSVLRPYGDEEALQLAKRLRVAAPPETEVVMGGAALPSALRNGRMPAGVHAAPSIEDLLEVIEVGAGA